MKISQPISYTATAQLQNLNNRKSSEIKSLNVAGLIKQQLSKHWLSKKNCTQNWYVTRQMQTTAATMRSWTQRLTAIVNNEIKRHFQPEHQVINSSQELRQD